MPLARAVAKIAPRWAGVRLCAQATRSAGPLTRIVPLASPSKSRDNDEATQPQQPQRICLRLARADGSPSP